MTDTNTSGADVLAKMDRQHDFFIRAGRYNGRESCWFNSGEEETVKSEYACIRTAVAALIARNAELAKRIAELEANAGRYLDLRDMLYIQNIMIGEAELVLRVYGACPTQEEFDAGIDAARASAATGGGNG